jgi:hypothetical protein
LLANAVYQLMHSVLTQRIREQACSHSGLHCQIKYENATFKCRLSDSPPRNSAFVRQILYASRLFMRPHPKRKPRARPVGPHKGRQHFPHP